jgi:DNA-binding NarL/FixJ family response regulator
MDLIGVKVTPRDQPVLNLLVQGSSNQEIAGQLSFSPRTVKQHLRMLFLHAGIRGWAQTREAGQSRLSRTRR